MLVKGECENVCPCDRDVDVDSEDVNLGKVQDGGGRAFALVVAARFMISVTYRVALEQRRQKRNGVWALVKFSDTHPRIASTVAKTATVWLYSYQIHTRA